SERGGRSGLLWSVVFGHFRLEPLHCGQLPEFLGRICLERRAAVSVFFDVAEASAISCQSRGVARSNITRARPPHPPARRDRLAQHRRRREDHPCPLRTRNAKTNAGVPATSICEAKEWPRTAIFSKSNARCRSSASEPSKDHGCKFKPLVS